MENKIFTDIFRSLQEEQTQENIELAKDLAKDLEIDGNYSDFHYELIYPYHNFLKGFIAMRYHQNDDLEFLFINGGFIKRHFKRVIVNFEGSVCSADKSRGIINILIRYFISKTPIVFEDNYSTCKLTFINEEDVLSFYYALKQLHYGVPDSYFEEYKKMLERVEERKVNNLCE